MVGVTSQGSNRRSQQRSGSGRVSNESVRQNRNAGNKIQGPIEKHTPRHRLQVWPSLKYTSIISFRCLADYRVESLIAESTPLASPGTAAHKAGESHHYWQVHS
ncbi:unnamed protein product [Staurois parvus]|uniref:Uncharacterized protein n=1 Tax=Staurois parvus TaxID=386267 RepID=A0ABN9BIT5_9NEOB|nr:unnamed protein product [Staurois parvus]